MSITEHKETYGDIVYTIYLKYKKQGMNCIRFPLSG